MSTISFLASDFGYGFAQGVSPVCLSAFVSIRQGISTSCGTYLLDSAIYMLSNPNVRAMDINVLENWMSTTYLPSLCSTTCKAVINSIPATLTAACGSQPILNASTFSGSPVTASVVSSYANITYTIGCIKTTDYGIQSPSTYCSSETIPYMYAMVFMQPNPNVFPRLYSYFNPCSQCTSAVIDTATKATWFIDYARMNTHVSRMRDMRNGTCPVVNAVSTNTVNQVSTNRVSTLVATTVGATTSSIPSSSSKSTSTTKTSRPATSSTTSSTTTTSTTRTTTTTSTTRPATTTTSTSSSTTTTTTKTTSRATSTSSSMIATTSTTSKNFDWSVPAAMSKPPASSSSVFTSTYVPTTSFGYNSSSFYTQPVSYQQPTNTFTSSDYDSGFVRGVSKNCMQTYTTIMPDLAVKCRWGFVADMMTQIVGIQNLQNNELDNIRNNADAAFFPAFCSSQCQDAINGLQMSLGSQCGDRPIVQGSTPTGQLMTASTISSYLSLFSTVSCIKGGPKVPSPYSFCGAEIDPGIIATMFTTNAVIPSIPFITNLYCSPCFKAAVDAASQLKTFVDYPMLQTILSTIKSNTDLICLGASANITMPNVAIDNLANYNQSINSKSYNVTANTANNTTTSTNSSSVASRGEMVMVFSSILLVAFLFITLA